MTSTAFVLIVSAIIGGQGQTIAARQDSFAACNENRVWYESELSRRGVRPLASKCQAQIRFIAYVKEVPQPEAKPFKPEKVYQPKKRRIIKKIKRASCYMRYRYIHHQRYWYCSRRR